MKDLFEIKSYKKRFDANKVKLTENIGYPYIVRQSNNNGQKGFINENPEFLNDGNTISFGQDTATIFYQENSYFTGDKIKILHSKNNKFRKENALFFISAMNKAFSNFSWGSSRFDIETLESQKILLPTKDGEIDFEFMEKFITELEAERITELEAYLIAAGLKDTKLTAEEKFALENISLCHFEKFLLKDLFEKLNLKFKRKNFDKRFDVSQEPTAEFSLPLVNAKDGNNGIMFYGREEDWEFAEMTIDIISNGAIATGNVYLQPQKTGVMWDAYLIKPKFTPSVKLLNFFATVIFKTIKPKYAYEFKATWNRVSEEKIYLPTKDGEPDFEYMEKFISAVQKTVIAEVVKYSEEKISAYRQAANK